MKPPIMATSGQAGGGEAQTGFFLTNQHENQDLSWCISLKPLLNQKDNLPNSNQAIQGTHDWERRSHTSKK